MIRISSAAASQLRDLLTQKGESTTEKGLRLQIQRGGCAGMQYAMKIDAPAAGDQIASLDGVFIMVDPVSLPYLDGCELDYENSLSDQGFRIHNPNAARSCGCGTSFEPLPAAKTSPAAVPQGAPCPSESETGSAA